MYGNVSKSVVQNLRNACRFWKGIGISMEFTTFGALIGLIIAIILIIKKVPPAYSLILGALIGGIVGGGGLTGTVNTMVSGAQGMMSSVLRILTSGILAGAMIHAGATVIDSLPHGSFFHATGGSVNMQIRERMKLIPYEALVGLTSTIVSSIIYLL